MNVRRICYLLIAILALESCINKNKKLQPIADKKEVLYERGVKEYLGYPFGTVLELEGELVSGETRHLKGDDGILFLRVTSIAGVAVKKQFEMRFEDETGKVSPDDFGLYRSIHYWDIDIVDPSDTVRQISKGSIAQKVKLAAYETGHFSGIPEKYTDYLPQKADKNFHFENSLVVIGCLNCKKP